MTIHHIINSHGLTTGGAERLASQLTAALQSQGWNARLLGLANELGATTPYSWKAFSGVLNYLRRSVVPGDIVHAHLSPSVVYCALAKLILRKPFHLVSTEHNTHNNRRGTLKGKLVDTLVYRMMDHVICISEGAKHALNEWMPVTKLKSSVVHNGVPLHFSAIPNRPSRDTLRMVSVGRLHRQKNISNALRAFAILVEGRGSRVEGRASRVEGRESRVERRESRVECAGGQHMDPRHSTLDPRLEYHIAGTGELETELKTLAEELEIADKVTFLGHVSDVPALLADSDIFLMPSKWEGFGLAAVEAMNAGLPVVASDVAGLREVVESRVERRGSRVQRSLKSEDGRVGSCALLVDPKDPEDIARALAQLMDSPELRQELGRNGFERAKDFSEEKMFQAYLELYEQINKS